MRRITQDALTSVNFEMQWKSPQATHTERYIARGVNLWRDCLPEALAEKIEGKTTGDTVTMDFGPGIIMPGYDPEKTFVIKQSQFDKSFTPNRMIQPRSGRFYPKGLLKGVAGVFPQNLQPFRLVGVQNGQLHVDFNHPLAKTAFQLRTSIEKIIATSAARGGRCHDWTGILSDGPGMQVRWENTPTEFLEDDPFARRDKKADPLFYQRPRLVQHIDDAAAGLVGELYGRLLKSGMRVLDLMSSWQSHVPSDLDLSALIGLGLNRQELEKNLALNDWVVHDLNENPILPFAGEEFDAVICTVSVEYLIQPEAVFDELARILRSDGLLIVTFSNRWFPPKVIRIWEELHEFERMGLVLEYFQRAGRFKDLETFSARGLQRPFDDKYFPEKRYSDPIYAVWGRKDRHGLNR
jgi:SAM-dependent methyltransferase